MAAAQLTMGVAAMPKSQTALIGTYCAIRTASMAWDARSRPERLPLRLTGTASASAKA